MSACLGRLVEALKLRNMQQGQENIVAFTLAPALISQQVTAAGRGRFGLLAGAELRNLEAVASCANSHVSGCSCGTFVAQAYYHSDLIQSVPSYEARETVPAQAVWSVR